MLSERYTTNFIQLSMLKWSLMSAPYPREIVIDSSKTLINAVIRAFTFYPTVQKYANASKKKIMPECYVWIDIAHFIKMYAQFLKTFSKRIKIFYLAFIGHLVMCRNIQEKSCHNIKSNIDSCTFRNREYVKQ